jgi:tRNA A-37 threonylcarbamoyl transferase component Bud32
MSSPDEPSEIRPSDAQAGEGLVSEGSGDLEGFKDFVGSVLRRTGQADRPERIDKFQVIDMLGEGTYGRVYRVHDPDLDCYRAAKIPTELVLNNPLLQSEFLREARNLQKIEDHPNVVRVVQAGEDDGHGRPYFVMEFCRDRSLASWLHGRKEWRADEKWAARLVAQIADGVHQIHQHSLCHRDLKPGNILLVRVGEGGDPDRPDFRPKVADFGLASVLDDPEATASLLEGPVGTPAYMAPEQAQGRRGEIGPATDVYGLGAILFEVVSGRRAYSSPSRGEIFESLQSDLPSPRLKDACARASRSMQTVVETAMRKEPRFRYASAAELSDDLKRLADGRPVRGTTWLRRTLYLLRRHRRTIIGVVLAFAVTAMAVEAGRIRAERRAASASIWLRRMETALPSEVAELIRERDPRDPSVAGRLAAMFGTDEPVRKLNAALALAASRPDCAAYVLDRMLALPSKDVGPIAWAISASVPDLVGRLASEATRPRSVGGGEIATAASRRRANAALALFLLGKPRLGSPVLGDLGDPDTRSLLVHSLGPAGVPPSVVVGLASDPATTTPVRRQLLLAMGEIPSPAWHSSERSQAVDLTLTLYSEDFDPGVHGAAKWLLKTWGLSALIAKSDADLVSPEPRPGFGWRVDASGLTFVVVVNHSAGYQFEISDTEVPWKVYRDFDPKFPGPGYNHVLTDEEPTLGVSFLKCAAFSNWFGARVGFAPAYDPAIGVDSVPIASAVILTAGYRVPTTREFVLAARAGTDTSCYFGDLREMIPHYAFTADTLGRPGVQDVGLLKPNDFGLFDTIGNGLEICHFDGPLERTRNQISLCGGSGIQSSANLAAVPRDPPGPATKPMRPSGFRLARSLGQVILPQP